MALLIGISIVASLLPLILMAAVMGEMVMAGVVAASSCLAWMSIRFGLPSDSAWKTFLVDIFGGLWIGILGAMLTGLTLTVVWVTIAPAIIYAILDVYVPTLAFLLLLTRRSQYA